MVGGTVLLHVLFLLRLPFSRAARVRTADELFDEAAASLPYSKAQIAEVLEGVWDTDYVPTLASGFSEKSTKVTFEEMSDEDKEFLHGELEGRIAFRARSPKFEGSEGTNGDRLITVESISEMNTHDQVLAGLDQRLDSMQPSRHSGVLRFTKTGYSITWNNGRTWTRTARERAAGSAGSSVGGIGDGVPKPTGEHAEHHANALHAKHLSRSLVNEWTKVCDLKPEIVDVPPIDFELDVEFGAYAGFDLSKAGAGVTVGVQLCAQPQNVMRSQARLTCILDQMKQWTASKSNTTEASEASASAIDLLVERFAKWSDASLMAQCWAGFCLSMDFDLMPYPPFVWPVPGLGGAFQFPMSVSDIMDCSVHANATGYISDAFASRPDKAKTDPHLDNITNATKQQVTSGGNDGGSLSWDNEWTQGPSFGLFPPGGVGWWWNVDVTVTVPLRKLVKSWHRAERAVLTRPESTCEEDREEYFRSVRLLAKSARDIATSSECQVVKSMLNDIKSRHPKVDLERDPLSAVPYLAQLSGDDYHQDDSFDISLGGGFVYVGTDGLSVGYYHNTALSTTGYHNGACKPFQDFVNVYQTRVVYNRRDVLSLTREEDCPLGALPPMEYHSCRAVDRGFADLPALPTILIGRPAAGTNHTRIVGISSSQCTRCLTTTSYGAACDFCSKEGLVMGAPTCRQHGSFHRPCVGHHVETEWVDFDKNKRSLAERCVTRENVLYADTKTPADIDLSVLKAMLPAEFTDV